MADCTHKIDPLKLVREGTSQEQRAPYALDPARAPVDTREPAQHLVFAQAYTKFLNYYDSENSLVGNWQPFFTQGVTAQLAIAAVQDVDFYRQELQHHSAFLQERANRHKVVELRDRLDYLFSACATLALRFDALAKALPPEIGLKNTLQNLIQRQLAPALIRMIGYHKRGDLIRDGQDPLNTTIEEKALPPTLQIFGAEAVRFSALATAQLSQDWHNTEAWATFYTTIPAQTSENELVYGPLSGTTVFERANHIATHNLFTSIFDQFLKVYARTVSEAQRALQETFTSWDRHEPHYALFLAFLRLFEYARAELNTLTQRHLDFYYRHVLQLKEKAATPSNAHLLIELAKHVASHELKTGNLFRAGKDDRGRDAFFSNGRELVANHAKVAALKTVYRHGVEEVVIDEKATSIHQGRLFAAPVSNSEDGQGEPLVSADQSWHPFFHKVYQDEKLIEIKMPQAETGFAIASHYLLLAEGTRTITVDVTVAEAISEFATDTNTTVTCLLTSEKGWLEKHAPLVRTTSGNLQLVIPISGNDPAVVPYTDKTHGKPYGYTFATHLPMLLVKLQHQNESTYLYAALQDVVIQKITLKVDVQGLKTLAVSNDFGPLDLSKPFQPFGTAPITGSALIIGAKEAVQKALSEASITVTWLAPPTPYKTSPRVTIDYLQAGKWVPSQIAATGISSSSYPLSQNLDVLAVDEPDFTANEFYSTASRHGFVRLALDKDFGQNAYQNDLIRHLRKDKDDKGVELPRPEPLPTGPSISVLGINYKATQEIILHSATDKSVFQANGAHFFHLAPFGHAEQHPSLNAAQKVYLLPQFTGQKDSKSEAELYIGITGLKPAQSLALLFHVADGTAHPLSLKPDSHLQWSFLRNNEWISFAPSEVDDQTQGLLSSGIITLAIPRDASDTNTLLPQGMHWLRAIVLTHSEAVCRLVLVAAQGLKTTFVNKGNDPAFPANVLPADTINKLAEPHAAIKKISQPFPTFGGRGAEGPSAFYTRVSERLRHKDRAMTLWDYERVILEAFPQIYKVKCVNHTRYEPDESGTGIYQELAPGHVTIITIPNLQVQKSRDPLQPFTSLGLLQEIADFLSRRSSCFTKLHVRNPQFERVRVQCRVRLQVGADETFYEKKLQSDITRFLSPWAFAGGGSPSFGGKIYKSALINFVEEQPYVDYVTDFKLFHDIPNSPGTSDKNEIEGSRAVSLLVSAPASQHHIHVLKPGTQDIPAEHCQCEP